MSSKKRKQKNRNMKVSFTFGILFILGALAIFVKEIYLLVNEGLTTKLYLMGAASIVLLFAAGMFLSPAIKRMEEKRQENLKKHGSH